MTVKRTAQTTSLRNSFSSMRTSSRCSRCCMGACRRSKLIAALQTRMMTLRASQVRFYKESSIPTLSQLARTMHTFSALLWEIDSLLDLVLRVSSTTSQKVKLRYRPSLIQSLEPSSLPLIRIPKLKTSGWTLYTPTGKTSSGPRAERLPKCGGVPTDHTSHVMNSLRDLEKNSVKQSRSIPKDRRTKKIVTLSEKRKSGTKRKSGKSGTRRTRKSSNLAM